jgi:folate-dependent phosphoribosylglycinamide formyltransferase PurN
MPNKDNVRVTVLLNGKLMYKYAAEALERMVEDTSADINLLVINSDRESAKENPWKLKLWIDKGIQIWKKHGIWSLIKFKRAFFPPDYAKKVHVDSMQCLSETHRVYTEPISTEGLGNELPDDVVEQISQSSEVVIRFGFGILKGDILTCTKYGVWSFHHADIRKYRGRAGGFWAYINDDDEAGVTLQQLDESLDGGKIAVYNSVDIAEINTMSELRMEIHEISKDMLKKSIKRIENGSFDPQYTNDLGEVYTERKLYDIIKYVRRELTGKFKNFIGL